MLVVSENEISIHESAETGFGWKFGGGGGMKSENNTVAKGRLCSPPWPERRCSWSRRCVHPERSDTAFYSGETLIRCTRSLVNGLYRQLPQHPWKTKSDCCGSMDHHHSQAVARLTRFEGRGHKKVPKGPPFAYVFWKNSKTNFQRGEYWLFSPPSRFEGRGHEKKFQRVPPLLMFFENIQKQIFKGGVLAFLPSPSIWRGGGAWPPGPPLNAPLLSRCCLTKLLLIKKTLRRRKISRKKHTNKSRPEKPCQFPIGIVAEKT